MNVDFMAQDQGTTTFMASNNVLCDGDYWHWPQEWALLTAIPLPLLLYGHLFVFCSTSGVISQLNILAAASETSAPLA